MMFAVALLASAVVTARGYSAGAGAAAGASSVAAGIKRCRRVLDVALDAALASSRNVSQKKEEFVRYRPCPPRPARSFFTMSLF